MTEYIITEEQLKGMSFLAQTHPMADVDVLLSAEKEIRSHPLSDKLKEERERTMDEFGILHGEDAKRFQDYMNDTTVRPTEVSIKLIREAMNIADNGQKEHDAEIRMKERKRYADAILRIGSSDECPSPTCRRENSNDVWGCVKCISESLRGEP